MRSARLVRKSTAVVGERPFCYTGQGNSVVCSVLLYLAVMYIRPAVRVKSASIDEERNNKSQKEKERKRETERKSRHTRTACVYQKGREARAASKRRRSFLQNHRYRPVLSARVRMGVSAIAALGRLVGCSLHQAQHDHSGAATKKPQVWEAHLVGLREARCDMRSSQ